MKQILFSLLLICPFQFLCSQSTNTLTPETVMENIHEQWLIFPQEKIYIQTDKPCYVSGEKLFFRSFLLDAMSNLPAALSRYLYVELINPVDSVIIRQNIRQENTMFYGALLLPEYLPQGDYRLRAYTRFMENGGEEYFYSRPVFIADPSCIDTGLDAEFAFLEKNKVGVSLRFFNRKTNTNVSPDRILLRLNREKVKTHKPEGKETIDLKFDVPEQGRILLVETVINNKLFGQYLRIPHKKEDKFALRFYPEGGYLIPGKSNKIAFKAELPGGLEAEVNGDILDKNDNIVTSFSTTHEGMGWNFFNPEEGELYTAICRYKNDTIKVNLPPANPKATVISVQWNRNRLFVKLNKPDNLPQEKLYLIIHNRGMASYSGEWDETKEYTVFDKMDFRTGVSHLLLLNEGFDLLSERLIFVNNAENYSEADIQANKEIYKNREKVALNIGIPGLSAKDSIIANFSVSITDDKDVVIDTTTNIVSEILLASELKGSVSNPAYYFRLGKPETDADLLMMTQGWNRYNIPEAIKGNFKIPKIEPEMFQSFSGTVKGGLLSKPYTNAQITLYSINYNFIEKRETNEFGRFKIDNFELPDSTEYVMIALTPKGGDKLELYPDDIVYPEVSLWNRPEEIQTIPLPNNFVEYVSKSDWKYTNENGIRMVNLPEVTIRGENKQDKKFKTYYGLEPDSYLSEDFFEHYAGPDILYAIGRIPGVTIRGGAISFSRMSYNSISQAVPPPIFIVDGLTMHLMSGEEPRDYCNRILSNITPSDVVQVNAVKSAAKLSLYGTDAAGGVIEIYTKNSLGSKIQALQRFNSKVIKPLGYQLPVEFYSPQYDTPSALNDKNADLRSTIYWKPDVIASPEGKSILNFYTADTPSTYSVVIEGITSDGKLIHQQKNGMIKVRY